MTTETTSLRILSVNVGRSLSAQQIALSTAFQTNAYILLVQEPYVFKEISRRITCKHPSFECFTPINNWSTRPRVLTYSRISNTLSFVQERPYRQVEKGAEDVLILTIKGPSLPPTQVINVYNDPPGAIYPGAGVSFLVSIPENQFQQNIILAGDFNLHCRLWHPSHRSSPSTQSDALISWLEPKNISFISEIDKPTHNRGNVLDLAFASASVITAGIAASVQRDLDVTSDHYQLLIVLSYKAHKSFTHSRLRFSTVDTATFYSLLQSQLNGTPFPSDGSSPSLDKRAEDLIQILHNSFAGSAKRSL